MKFPPWANHDIMSVQSIRNSCLFCGTFHFFSLSQHLVSCVFIWQTLILDLLENREREVPICSTQILPRKKGHGHWIRNMYREYLLTCNTNIKHTRIQFSRGLQGWSFIGERGKNLGLTKFFCEFRIYQLSNMCSFISNIIRALFYSIYKSDSIMLFWNIWSSCFNIENL